MQVWRNGETHFAQILDEPYDILVLKLWDTAFELCIVEEVGELIGKLG